MESNSLFLGWCSKVASDFFQFIFTFYVMYLQFWFLNRCQSTPKLCFPYFFFMACGSFQARGWIPATAVTYTTAAAMPDPLIHSAGDWTGAATVTQAAAVRFIAHCFTVGTPFQTLFWLTHIDVYVSVSFKKVLQEFPSWLSSNEPD